MHPPAPSRLLSVLKILAVQTALWLVLALAFATLLVIAGGLPWTDAFAISALNWLPWAMLAPLVFWLSLRHPLLPGQLWRHGPIHLAACAVCVVLTLEATRLAAPPGPRLTNIASPDFALPPRPDRPPYRPRPMDGVPPRRDSTGSDEATATDRPRERQSGLPSVASDQTGFGDGEHPGPKPPPFSSILLRTNFSIAVYLIVATAAHAFIFFRRSQERSRQALQLAAGLNEAKLDVLRLQLQPHFLFNTLNAIATLVHRDAHAADKLIGHLADLLRLSLLTSDHVVPLTRELDLLDRYLAIEQARLGDRLRVIRTIDPAVTGALVPTFVLQPLVENAIRHGVEPRCVPGTISLSADRVGSSLRLVVADDGVGLVADKPTSRRGIGLANTEARIRALHGAAAKLEFSSPPAGGVQVVITLPFQVTPAPTKI